MRTALVVLLLGSLAGCASPEEVRAFYGRQCASYGFKPGTDGYAHCIQSKVQEADAEFDRRLQSTPVPKTCYTAPSGWGKQTACY